jgi:hypothetical protein
MPVESLMRDQFSVACRCGQSVDPNSVSTRESVRTRDYTFYRCHGCGEVWRERHGVLRSFNKQRRRSTDHRLQPARVA